jgi:xanthine dehydrogenase small subunit
VQTLPKPNRDQINDALSGNLCRCTGYKPIVDATMQACSSSPAALKIEDKQDIALLKEIRRAKVPTFSLDGDIIVQPVLRTRKGNEFVAPATVDEVADYLQKHPKATIVAGSTEIGLQVNKQFVRPDHVLYVGNVAEMKSISVKNKAWHIGAAVSLTQVQELVSQAYPDFAEVLRRFGSPPIRSTATLAGNIANGSPIGDSMPCLLALGATLTLRKGDKTREVKLENFYTGMKKSVLAEGEFIETVVIPQPATGSTFRAHKISKRFDQDISATVCAMNFELVNGKFKNVKLAYNGLSPYPSRAPKLEAIIEGNTPAGITNDALDAAITSSFPARDGLRATWAYRSLVARNLVMQFIEEATQSTSNVKEAA